MSSAKTKKTIPLGSLLDSALRKKGLALPETEDEISAAEKELQGKPIDYPARLLMTPNFRAGGEPKFRLQRRPVVDATAAEEMARAARGGGAIPTEVEERMARDRAAAAPQGGDDEDEKN